MGVTRPIPIGAFSKATRKRSLAAATASSRFRAVRSRQIRHPPIAPAVAKAVARLSTRRPSRRGGRSGTRTRCRPRGRIRAQARRTRSRPRGGERPSSRRPWSTPSPVSSHQRSFTYSYWPVARRRRSRPVPAGQQAEDLLGGGRRRDTRDGECRAHVGHVARAHRGCPSTPHPSASCRCEAREPRGNCANCGGGKCRRLPGT